MRIAKTFAFDASHVLADMPPGHPCGRLHGHTYHVTLILRSSALDHRGFIRDYGELDWFRDLLRTEYDHRHLNAVVDFNPTAELLARHFYRIARTRFPEIEAVRVSETPSTWAEFGGDDG